MRALGLCFLVACASSAEATPSAAPVDAGPPTVSAEECTTRCTAKAEACGAPSAQAGTICAQMCTAAVTEAQAACLEGKSCADLISAASQGSTLTSICGGPEPGTNTALGPTTVPAELTLATGIPAGYVVDHSNAGGMRSSLFNVAGPPVAVPTLTLGQFPELTGRNDIEVVSPPRNGCESVVNVTISATQLAVSTSGVDVLPETKCADFLNAIASQGATLKVKRVTWKGSTETSKVTIVLKKL